MYQNRENLKNIVGINRIGSILFIFLLVMAISIILTRTAEVSADEDQETKMLVQVNITNQIQLNRLLAMHLDIAAGNRKDGCYTIVANEEDIQRLEDEGFSVKILISDLEQNNSLAISGKSNFGSYHTYQEAQEELESIHADHPELTTDPQVIGYSCDGREIWAIKISDNPDIDEDEPEVLYTAVHHAREPISLEVLLYFVNYLTNNYGTDSTVTTIVDERELWFIPIVNPDGYVYNETYPSRMWRKNRCNNGDGTYGVDLNRNYGYQWGYDNLGSSPTTSDEDYRGTEAFSEPETQAVRDFCEEHEFVLALNYHCYGNQFLYPWGYQNIYAPDHGLFSIVAGRMTKDNDYDRDILYNINGDADDWMYGEQITKNVIYSFLVEVGTWSDGFWPSEDRIIPLCEENLGPNLFFASIADDPPGTDNLALSATATASSIYSANYRARKAIDGIYGAWDESEWASDGEMTPWLRLTWDTAQTVNKIIFYDRCNPVDHIVDAMLYLKRNGSVVKSIHLGMFPYGGSAKEIVFDTVTIDEVYLDVLDGVGLNIGLSEIEVYFDTSVSTKQNLARDAAATASSIYSDDYNQEKAIDGIYGAWDESEWASDGEMTPWLRLTWDTAQTVNKIIFYDRCNPVDHIVDAMLYLKRNGSVVKSIHLGMFPYGGSAKEIVFDTVTIDEVYLDVLDGVGLNIGLSEIEVYFDTSVSTKQNLARDATATTSSIYDDGYSQEKAIDGIYGAWDESEWASDGEMTPWLRLTWDTAQTVNKIIFYDRCNPVDHIVDAMLYLKRNGSVVKSIHLGMFPYGGSAKEIVFDTVTIDEVYLDVLDGVGLNIGLSEIEVYPTEI